MKGYFAAVLDIDTATKLSALAFHTNVYASHVTMAYNPSDEVYKKYAPLVGQWIEFDIVAFFLDMKGQAAAVVGVPSENANPHVTISCADGVKPVYSNELIRTKRARPSLPMHGRAIVKWIQQH